MSDPKEAIRKALDDLPLEPGDVLKEFSYDGQDRVESDADMVYGFSLTITAGMQILRARILRACEDGSHRRIHMDYLGGGWVETGNLLMLPPSLLGRKDV
jgi:hypothetical protein